MISFKTVQDCVSRVRRKLTTDWYADFFLAKTMQSQGQISANWWRDSLSIPTYTLMTCTTFGKKQFLILTYLSAQLAELVCATFCQASLAKKEAEDFEQSIENIKYVKKWLNK